MMKGLTATVILFVHAIHCQRRKVPEKINPRLAPTSSIGISDGKGRWYMKGFFKYLERNSDWQCR